MSIMTRSAKSSSARGRTGSEARRLRSCFVRDRTVGTALVAFLALAAATTFGVGAAPGAHGDRTPWFGCAAALLVAALAAMGLLWMYARREVRRLALLSGNDEDFNRVEPRKPPDGLLAQLEGLPRQVAPVHRALFVACRAKLLRVTNVSAVRAFRCRVEIDDVTPAAPYSPLPIALVWWSGDGYSTELDLKPNGHAYVVLLRTWEQPPVMLSDGPLNQWPDSPIEISVVASCDPPSKECQARFRIDKTAADQYPFVTLL
jgi:hypothetical protein